MKASLLGSTTCGAIHLHLCLLLPLPLSLHLFPTPTPTPNQAGGCLEKKSISVEPAGNLHSNLSALQARLALIDYSLLATNNLL